MMFDPLLLMVSGILFTFWLVTWPLERGKKK